jgi:hypothetical protein
VTAVAKPEAVEAVLIQGDLKALTPEQRTDYYLRVCASLGLNPLTRPFEYLTFQGRLILYARRDATEQLRRRDGVSITIVGRKLEADVYTVSARAKTADGREDESDGAVFVGGLRGEALANAYMKAETKAKRRVTLSICGLGMLDETEVGEAPAAPAHPVKAEPARELVEAKPTPDPRDESYNERAIMFALLTRKGKDWEACTTWLNHTFHPEQPYNARTRLSDVPAEQRQALVAILESMPDAAAPQKAG